MSPTSDLIVYTRLRGFSARTFGSPNAGDSEGPEPNTMYREDCCKESR